MASHHHSTLFFLKIKGNIWGDVKSNSRAGEER